MLEVIEASGLVTIQDAGRKGWQKFGVPVSGPMDWFAHRAANLLVGNEPEEAAVEIGLGEFSFLAKHDCVVAVTGAGYEVQNYTWTFPLWTSFYVRAGWVVHIKKAGRGNWAYLAVAGGLDVEKFLGSRSTYGRGKMGENISAGMKLNVGRPARGLDGRAARDFPSNLIPVYSQHPVIDVIAGPQRERFTTKGVKTFFESEYALSKSFDRMGYRLEGNVIALSNGADLISEGMTMGSVQVPANGQPIVVMADAPTTGGYPKIACVTRISLPILAQCDETSRIRFREISVGETQGILKEMMHALNSKF
jgi:biotin-dependent carboxylase-like uncharacterized protein